MHDYCIVNCGHPELLSTTSNDSVISNDSVPSIDISTEYAGLTIEGNAVTFTCPPGLVLIGPNSAICTENREWEPDPSGLMCKGNNPLTLYNRFSLKFVCKLCC